MGEFRFDPEELEKDEIVLDKFEAAKLQIISAIKMFFHDWDSVSQLTLTAAAHQILYDISNIKSRRLSFKDSPLIKKDKRREYISAVNKAQNYFKHADKDHKTKLLFRRRFTPLYLFDTIRMYTLLTGNDPCFEIRVFLMWFQLRFPDLLNLPSAEEDLRKIRAETRDPNTFRLLGLRLLQSGKLD